MIVNSETLWVSPVGMTDVPSIEPAMAPNIVFWRLATIPPWVLIAPFGFPVVPLV